MQLLVCWCISWLLIICFAHRLCGLNFQALFSLTLVVYAYFFLMLYGGLFVFLMWQDDSGPEKENASVLQQNTSLSGSRNGEENVIDNPYLRPVKKPKIRRKKWGVASWLLGGRETWGVHLHRCGWEARSKTGEAHWLSGRSRRMISRCLLNYTLILVCNAPSFPSSLLLTWKGQWSIALKALKAARLQMGIVSFTSVCSQCRQDLLSEEKGDTKVLAAQCFPAGSTEYKGIIRLWLSGRLEEKLLQSTLPGLII